MTLLPQLSVLVSALGNSICRPKWLKAKSGNYDATQINIVKQITPLCCQYWEEL